MGRRAAKQAKGKRAAKVAAGEAPPAPASDYVQPADPPRAVMAVHPTGAAVAVAVGPELRVYDARTKELKVLVSKPEPQPEGDKGKGKGGQAAGAVAPVLRGVAFDGSGRFLLVGSEDKGAGMRLWDCDTWELQQAIKVPKKVSTCCFTADGRYMLAADKFGDVLAAATAKPQGLAAEQQQEPELLLGHYCSILTSLSLSAGGHLLATTDRDQRVRVSIVPADPMAGAHEIQSYCLGHTSFVTCSAFVQQGDQELLVTGGGDGMLRLWDPLSGTLLHTVELPPLPEAQQAAQEQQEQQPEEQPKQQQQEEEEAGGSGSSDDEEAAGEGEASATVAAPIYAPVPLALAAAPDGSCLVAAVDGRDDLYLVRLDWSARELQESGWHALPGLHLPACLAFDAGGRLWAAGGPVADDSTAAFLACANVAAGGEGGQQLQIVAAPLPDWLPAEAARQLEAQTGGEAAVLAAAADQRRLACQLLRKRQYTPEDIERRKRMRRDRRAKQQQLQQQQQQQGKVEN